MLEGGRGRLVETKANVDDDDDDDEIRRNHGSENATNDAMRCDAMGIDK